MKKIFYTLFFCFLLCLLVSCSKSYKIETTVLGETKTVEMKKGQTYSLENIEKVGYAFDGWFYDEKFSSKANDFVVEKDVKLFAKLVKTSTVTLVIKDTVITKVFREDQVFEETYEETGYVFLHWCLDEGLDVPFEETYITEDITLYALIVPLTHLVEFEPMGAQSYNPQKVNDSTPVKRPIEDPFKLGFVFKHWSMEENGEPYDFTSLVTSSFTLYAVYEEINYNIILDEYVPSVIEGDIELPEWYAGGYLYWKSSDPSILTSYGSYNAPREEKVITIICEIMNPYNGDSVEITKDVTIKPYSLKDISDGNIVVGYTSSWYFAGYSEEVLQTVDVLNVSFAYVHTNGLVNLSSVLNMIPTVTRIAHANGIRVVLSIQGYGEDTKNFSDCAASPELRSLLAKDIAKTVLKYNLDGIDIDWEYPGSADRVFTEDRVNYTLLMQEIRKELDALNLPTHLLLTAAIPAGNLSENFEMNNLGSIFDYIYMMSYDCQSSSTGSHHSPLYPSDTKGATLNNVSIDETTKKWVSLGVPKNKICLGIAFYGKYLRLQSTSNNGLGIPADPTMQAKYKNVTYESIQKNVQYIGKTFGYYFDEVAHAPYIFSQARYFYTYDNERSVIDKCNYALDEGLGGVMIWEIGEDPTNKLITAVAQGMKIPAKDAAYVAAGESIFKVGNVFVLNPVNEVLSSVLNEQVEYIFDDASAFEFNGRVIKCLKTGSYNISIVNKNDSSNYGTISIVVE